MLPFTLIFIFVLWALGFMLIERASMLSGIVAIGCFVLPIPLVTTPLEFILENAGTLSDSTIALTSTSQSYFVLIDVFFLFISLINQWNIVTGIKRKPDD